jgi:hypothetical protein
MARSCQLLSACQLVRSAGKARDRGGAMTNSSRHRNEWWFIFAQALRDERQHPSIALTRRPDKAQAKRFIGMIWQIVLLPGASQLLKNLTRRSIPFAIATSGDAKQTNPLVQCIVDSAKSATDWFGLAANKFEKNLTIALWWTTENGTSWQAGVIALKEFDRHELQESEAYRVYACSLELSETCNHWDFRLSCRNKKTKRLLK